MTNDMTQKFDIEHIRSAEIKDTLTTVFNALEAKGYNPLSQLTGYLLSGDPAFIPRYADARILLSRIPREEILEAILREYLNKQ